MPRGQGPTPTRAIRVPDELWQAAQRVAADKGTSVNREIIRFLERLVARHPLPPED